MALLLREDDVQAALTMPAVIDVLGAAFRGQAHTQAMVVCSVRGVTSVLVYGRDVERRQHFSVREWRDNGDK
jgi:ornithine cyclodeaminase/alanine dehydrogenase-like protein (mu-crystallin family)